MICLKNRCSLRSAAEGGGAAAAVEGTVDGHLLIGE